MPAEIIVVLSETRPLERTAGGLSAPQASPIAEVLNREGLSLQPLFLPAPPAGPAFGADERLASGPESDGDFDIGELEAQMGRYFTVEGDVAQSERLAEELRELPGVETAYVKPAAENPLAPRRPLGEARPQGDVGVAPPAPAGPPDFRMHQGYLAPAPGGIDVQAAWSLPGGRGAGVRIVDIEGGWCFSHISLAANSGGLLAGVGYPGLGWRNHGTAVLGQLGGDDNGFGVIGIAPSAVTAAVSHNPSGSAAAIRTAATMLHSGDVLLLEMHRPGPRHGFTERADQKGYIAVEWWPDDFLAIRWAVARGVIVVEAAGNGGEDLDSPLYDRAPQHFPAAWRNPFGQGVDSQAIVVGAGAPPNGVYGPDRSRLDFSNHGRRVDCQGWGRSVVTTGYGDLHGGPNPANEDEFYTHTFGGTSSASPIVAGAIACLQGIAKERGQLISPAHIRGALRSTGSPQAASATAPVSQHIGPRPDLAALIQHLFPAGRRRP